MMNFEVHGNPANPSLLLMHGFMSSNTQWELNVVALSEHLQVVLVELVGHGSSQAPTDLESYERSAVLTTLDSIRAEVGVDSWWVGGHSLGGATSIRYALDHPERTRGIVFTNTRAAFGTAKGGEHAVELVSAVISEPEPDLRSLPYHPIGAKHFPADIKARMVAIADAIKPHVLLNTVSNRTGWSSVDDLHRLAMPTMLINGRFERAFQPFVEVATEALPTLRVAHFDGGHSINIEQPGDYNRAVIAFITEHEAAM